MPINVTNTSQDMMWTNAMDSEYDPMDPADETTDDNSFQSRRLSQDEQIKAYEATLANEARRNAEIERENQELQQLQQLIFREEQTRLEREREAYSEEQSRLEQERMYQLAQLELAQLEEERWRRLQMLKQHQLQQQKQPNRKSVGFADSALLYSSDRTLEEVNLMWYSKDELAAFKNERKLVVKALKRAHFDVAAVERSGSHCLRGYEAYFSLDVNKAMKDARTLVTSLVLTEQERQRSLNMRDDEAVRFACSSVSQWACDNASKLGENDEVDVYGVYESEYGMEYADYDAQGYDNGQNLSHASMDMTMDNTDPNDDNLAERLESALKLVRALRSGTQSNSIGL